MRTGGLSRINPISSPGVRSPPACSARVGSNFRCCSMPQGFINMRVTLQSSTWYGRHYTLQIASDPRAKLSPGLGEMPGAHRKEGQLARHSEFDDDFSERAGLN